MTVYVRMSTPSRSAARRASASGRTLKPMITASEAEASMTSDSLIPPVWAWMMLTATCSCGTLAISSWSASSELLTLQPSLALLRERARLALVLHHLDVLPRLADAVEAQDLDGHPGRRFLDALALVVEHRPDLAPDRTRDNRVADPKRPALDEDAGDRTPTRIEAGFDHGARGRRIRIRRELLQVGDQQNHVQQVVETVLRLRRHVGVDGVAAPLLGVQL